jgi:hypothetical protein
MAIQLRAGSWKKAGSWFGTSSRKPKILVGTDRECRWPWEPVGSDQLRLIRAHQDGQPLDLMVSA